MQRPQHPDVPLVQLGNVSDLSPTSNMEGGFRCLKCADPIAKEKNLQGRMQVPHPEKNMAKRGCFTSRHQDSHIALRTVARSMTRRLNFGLAISKVDAEQDDVHGSLPMLESCLQLIPFGNLPCREQTARGQRCVVSVCSDSVRACIPDSTQQTGIC